MIPVDSASYDTSQYGQCFSLDGWSMPSPAYSSSVFNMYAIDGSRTDKPQMAHEIYKRLLVIASSPRTPPSAMRFVPHLALASGAKSETMQNRSGSEPGHQLPSPSVAFNGSKIFNKQDILIAAYTGCNLMYRQQQTPLN